MCEFLTISQPKLKQAALTGGKTSSPAPLQKKNEKKGKEKHKKIVRETKNMSQLKNAKLHVTIYSILMLVGECIYMCLYIIVALGNHFGVYS